MMTRTPSCFASAYVVPALAASHLLIAAKVDSKQSLENVESKWVGEIAENCQGVKLVLVALKCDLREKHGDDEEAGGNEQQGKGGGEGEKEPFIEYKEGLEVARRIQALRYLGNIKRQFMNPLDPANKVGQSARPSATAESTRLSQRPRGLHFPSGAQVDQVVAAGAT